MESAYKGYTITPRSERQPDGRWLPVAELETVQRGIVTTSPPVRGTSRETRAARAEADAAAVRLAKAWIDANEREPGTATPSMSTAGNRARVARPDPPAIVPAEPVTARAKSVPAHPLPAPPAAEATGVRADAPPRAKGVSERRPPAAPETPDWADLCQAVGLDADVKVDRLSRVLAVHSVLDRLLTLVLATKIVASSESRGAPRIEKALADIAPLPMPARTDLGSALGLLSTDVAASIAEVDRVRHTLALPRPVRGRPPWDVGDIEEIGSQAACDRCVDRGIQAAHELIASLRVRWPSPQP